MLYMGLDLGQANDFTALSILEVTGPRYALRYLERVPLRTPYPRIVAKIVRMRTRLLKPGEKLPNLVIDATGVGAPVVDLFREAGLDPVAVTITGGNNVVRKGERMYAVPKRELVRSLLTMFETGSLQIAGGLRFAGPFVQELTNFRVRLNARTGHDHYEAGRTCIHDDLVLSVALAAWYTQYGMQCRPTAEG